MFAQSFPDVTTDVLGEAIGRHHRESDAPGDLGLVHDFVATILAVTVDDEHEWSVHYTPREWHGTQMPGCHLSRDGLEAAHVTFTGRHRPHGAGTLRLTTRIDTPFCALPRGPYEPPVNLSELFHDCDHDMLATVITALGTRIGA
nr:hypothetical protein [Cellulomonas chitinilytica]